jgi:hypothetical protein
MSRMPFAAGLAVAVAALAAFVGPANTGLHDKPAGEAFAYAMPEGFTHVPTDGALPGTERNVWMHVPLGNEALLPNVSITHVSDMGNFDDAKLAMIAAGMPAYFAASQVKWREVRHAQIQRRDGALVGLLEGENTLGDEQFRSLQLSFPDDRGTSLITANFPSREESHWTPIFEAPIQTTRGVATRGIRKPLWVNVAWGAGAGIASFAFLVFVGGRAKRVAAPA